MGGYNDECRVTTGKTKLIIRSYTVSHAEEFIPLIMLFYAVSIAVAQDLSPCHFKLILSLQF